MVNGFLNLGAAAVDLTLYQGDPFFQFVHRQMIDILPGEDFHRVVGALGEKIVWLHRHNVDPDGPHVNKPLVLD